VKVAVYARVSKADDSQDPENQLSRLRSYAQERGWEVYGEYVDRASGGNANRPSLKRMRKDATAHRFGLVITTKIDRIARSSLDLKLLISELEGRGIKFECTDQPFSTNTPTGKLLFGILGEIAEFERSLIIERTRDGLDRARAAGVHLGRKPDSARTAEIVKLKAQGLTVRQISEQMGIKPSAVKQRFRRHRLQNRGRIQK
jgi:DNA invertase Pin-like site-specific DNA recombinase